MKAHLKFCICIASLALGQVAVAQTSASAVTSTLQAQRVEMVEGKAVLKPAGQGKPGDLIEYSNTYRNGGTTSVEKLVATVPVPVGTTLVAGSLSPAKAMASTDGTQFAPMPLMRSVKEPNGTERKEPVPMANYRAVRWDIGGLSPGRSAVVSLRTRIDSAAPVQVPATTP